MANKICSQCSEENPDQAVQCMACDSPLSEAKASVLGSHPDESEVGSMSPQDSIERRISDTILLHSVKSKASQIRLSYQGKSIHIEFFIDDEWQSQMKFRSGILPAFHEDLITRAGEGLIEISHQGVQAKFVLQTLISAPNQEIFLTLLSENGSEPKSSI